VIYLFSTEILIEIYRRFADILLAPIYFKEMIWILTPLLVTLIMMELYFDRYRDEELGWNTAFGNSMVLIFVSLDILRLLYNKGMLAYISLESALVLSVIMIGFTLTLLTFFHSLPKQLAFCISSRLPINVVAYLTIVIVYAGIPVDVYTGIAALIFAFFVSKVLKILNWIIPESGEIPQLDFLGKE